MPEHNFATQPILIVDDEPDVLSLLQSFLSHDGFKNIVTFDDSRGALDFVRNAEPALAVIDLRMPKMNGRELLAAITEVSPCVPVIVVTAESDLEIAIDCMKMGAVDYLTKPISVSRFIGSVTRALELRSLNEDLLQLDRAGEALPTENVPLASSIITRDKEMIRLLRYVNIIARSDQPVLVSGETGVGKELIARGVHELSERQGGFVCINIAGLDDQMFSDTLFGHRRGAFTGAIQDRNGLIMKAANGTIFLDEIGDMNEHSQIKLLRLLQEGEYYQLGADTPSKSNARLVVATNCNLQQKMKEGRFRKDLYYRLCTHQAVVPPLRKRPGDIPLLIEHYVRLSARALGKGRLSYRRELADFLSTYPFPGNIRELQAIIHDLVSRTPSSRLSLSMLKLVISREKGAMPADIMPYANADQVGEIVFSSFPTLKEAELFLIERALELAKNNQGTAARMLGITRQGLNNRLRRAKAKKAA